MKGNPLVSVIIPLYNAADFIRETLTSVLNQTYSSIEVIVIDDGSKDEGPSIVKEIEAFDKRVSLFKQGNKGACAARNYGFKLSKGEYIQYLDADDIISQQKIEVQIRQLEKYPDCISNGRWGRFYSNINENIKWGPDKSLRRDLEPIEWLIQNHMSTNHAWLSPRNLIQKAGLWREDLNINQDGEYFSRVVLQSKKVLYCPSAMVYYRSRISGSVSSSIQNPFAIQSRFKTIKLLESKLIERENSPRVRHALANAYQDFIYSYFPKQPNLIAEAEKKVKEFGGSKLPVPGGEFYKLTSRFLGWKNVSRIKYLFGRL